MISFLVKVRSRKRERTSDTESACEQTSRKSKRTSDIESGFDGMHVAMYVTKYIHS